MAARISSAEGVGASSNSLAVNFPKLEPMLYVAVQVVMRSSPSMCVITEGWPFGRTLCCQPCFSYVLLSSFRTPWCRFLARHRPTACLLVFLQNFLIGITSAPGIFTSKPKLPCLVSLLYGCVQSTSLHDKLNVNIHHSCNNYLHS